MMADDNEEKELDPDTLGEVLDEETDWEEEDEVADKLHGDDEDEAL